MSDRLRYVMVADDHAVTRRGIRELIRDAFAGVNVTEVTDASAALAQVRARAWDLIVLDILMPGPSILEVLSGIRATSSSVPVLAVTALSEIEYVGQVMKAGANGIIRKSHAVEDIVQAIKTVAAGGTYLHPYTAAEIARGLGQGQSSLPHARLSVREREIFQGIARGRAVKEIAGDLGLSDKTVATYLARIREKTGLASHVDIARYALRHGLVE